METVFQNIENPSAASREKLKEDLRVLVRDAEELMKATASDMGEKAREARVRLSAALESAKSTCTRLEDQAIQTAKAADTYVHANPYPFIGAAFGLGVLLGVLINRK
jgi:ElaB/YqjD/DUF883 family membrane-anchored ribosome-binding protein